jgi:hypothetical protein
MELGMLTEDLSELSEYGIADGSSSSSTNVILAKLEAMEQKIAVISTSGGKPSSSSNTYRASNISPEEKERRRVERLCYHCGGRNHISRNCPKKGSSGPNNFKSTSNFRNNNINLDSSVAETPAPEPLNE